MDYKTIKITKAFFSGKEKQGRERLDLGMRLLGVLIAMVVLHTRTSRHRSSGAARLKGTKGVGDHAP